MLPTFVPTSEQTDKYRTMGATHTMEHRTIVQIAEQTGIQVEALRVKFRRYYPGVRFNKYMAVTPEQAEVLTTDKRRVVPVSEQCSDFETLELSDYSPVIEAEQPDIETVEQTPEPPAEQPDTTPEQPQTTPDIKPTRRAVWPMYVVMLLAAGTTMPNMYSVTLAIKANETLAALFTGCFTVAPFLLIYAGVRGFAGWLAVSFIILIEIFCNTAGIYGGLTGLNHSNFIAPTNFLHMATGFAFDSAYEPTARAIAGFMAVGIAVLMVISVKEIKNIQSSKSLEK